MKRAKIQIFKPGIYGQSPSRQWTEEEVKVLVKNYDEKYRKAPIILGHNDWNGEKPAYGWVKALSYDNGIVVADIEYSDELKKLVDEKKYQNVSIEVVKNIQAYDNQAPVNGGYLLAVAFLGGSQPAVAGLEPVKFNIEDKQFVESFEYEGFIVSQDTEHQETFTKPQNQTPQKNDTINENNDKGVFMTKEELQKLSAQVEQRAKELDEKFAMLAQKEKEFEAKVAKFEAEQKEFKRMREIESFLNENEKHLTPALKEQFVSFAKKLDDELFESYKEQFKKSIENFSKDNLTGEANFANTDSEDNDVEDFEAEALKDLEALN